MITTLFRIVLLLLFSTFLAACGTTTQNQSTSEPVQAETVTLKTNPEPPIVGDVELQLYIVDENGQPLEGATVDVSADHTDMRGMTMSGLATAQGNGRYAITADFSMSGNWKINVFVRKDSLDLMKEFNLTIR